MKTSCGHCGIKFSSPVIDLRRVDGETFFCPNGHRVSFASVIAREEAEAEAARQEAEAWSVEATEALYALEPTVRQQARRALRCFRGRRRA